MSAKTPEELIAAAQDWWSTGIIRMRPGVIEFRGYPVEELIGRVSFSQMIWLLLRGELATPRQLALLEAALAASVDHGPHAPSIAIARMAASCGVDLNNAMASAANVLGDSHGGAGEQCMELLHEVKRRLDEGEALAPAIDAALDDEVRRRGKIIAGFGHRFHPIDPRCAPLLAVVDKARDEGTVSGAFAEIARTAEAAIARRTGKAIPMNIDGATAVIFAELGFAPALGRGLFVLARSVGILAHAWEQMQTGERNKGPMPKEIPFNYVGPPRRAFGEDGEN